MTLWQSLALMLTVPSAVTLRQEAPHSTRNKMSLYKPFGNSKNEVVDPDKLARDWTEARNVINSTTSWQFCSQDKSGLSYSGIAKNGAGVRVLQKQRFAYAYAGQNGNVDAHNLMSSGSGLSQPWLIPYLRGYQDVFDGDLKITWTSEEPELVLIGYSMWAYRLSSSQENTNNYTKDDPLDSKDESTEHLGSSFYSNADVRVRTILGLRLDGSIIEGSGPGTNVATIGKEATRGSGSREKGIVTSSSSVHLLRAGTHTLSPVAGQTVAAKEDSGENAQEKITYFSNGYVDGEEGNSTNLGVGIINARVHVIRFPRGKMLGD